MATNPDVILNAFEYIDAYPATANPKAKRHYNSSPLSCYPTFLHQLIMLGRPHAWIHFDNDNVVQTLLNFGDEEMLESALETRTSKARTKYFAHYY